MNNERSLASTVVLTISVSFIARGPTLLSRNPQVNNVHSSKETNAAYLGKHKIGHSHANTLRKDNEFLTLSWVDGRSTTSATALIPAALTAGLSTDFICDCIAARPYPNILDRGAPCLVPFVVFRPRNGQCSLDWAHDSSLDALASAAEEQEVGIRATPAAAMAAGCYSSTALILRGKAICLFNFTEATL
jgi:hypothetical protein